MKTTTKFSIALLVLLVAGGTLLAEFTSVRERSFTQEQYTANVGEMTPGVVAGQTFVSARENLSAISVKFATYSGRASNQRIEFHLRSGIEATEDIRTAQGSSEHFGDNQLYRFEFEPIQDSQGKTYFFFVESPNGKPGAAITVDIDTRDPYHQGSAYVVRGAGVGTVTAEVLARSGKPTADLGFATFHTVSSREAITHAAASAARIFVGTWPERRGFYTLGLKAGGMAAFFLIVIWLLREKPFTALESWGGENIHTLIWILVLIGIGIGLRIMYAVELPLTNDEGNYLYDARVMLEGKLAGGDGYVKAPLVIVWVALWRLIGGVNILSGRLSSVVISALTLYPLYVLGRELVHKRIGIAVAAAWAVIGAPVVFGIYVHTQPLALFFGVSGLAVVLLALRGRTPKLTFLTVPKIPSSAGWFVWAGILLGLAVASRKSTLALGLPTLLLVLTEGTSWKKRIQHLLSIGIGFTIVIGMFLAAATILYGPQGFWEAAGFNSAEDGITAVDPAELEQVREYSLRGMTPFFRESLPLILMSLIGLGAVLERAIRAGLSWLNQKLSGSAVFLFDHILPKIGWFIPVLIYVWAWGFFREYEGSAFHIFGIPWLWITMGAVLLLAAMLPRLREEALPLPPRPVSTVPVSTQPGFVSPQKQLQPKSGPETVHFWPAASLALLVPLWVFGLVFFYMNWIKFHANYLAEFMPPLALLAGIGVMHIYRRLESPLFLASDYPPLEVLRRVVVLGVSGILAWALFASNFITYVFPHTGTFDQGSVKEAANWAKTHIQPQESIFTGAAIVPYLSGHAVALDIAHPRWYAYEFTRKDPDRLNTFLPPAEEMLKAFRETKWVLLEQQTGFSFLMEYSEIEGGLEKQFQKVQEIENGGNALKFYRRIR